MTATKQQQLEWLAKEFAVWPGFGGVPIRMSSVTIGEVNNGLGVAHHIRMEEWQQERDKMQKQQDNSWRERGEFPPVGCECEIMHKCWIEPNEVKIAAITKEYVIVVDCQREQHYHLRDITFRPLRTEREKAIDDMIAAIDHIKEGNFQTLIGALYDAGYRKVKP